MQLATLGVFTLLWLHGAAADAASLARIIGGNPTTIEQVPYQASLRLRVYIGRGAMLLVHICGGTLISQRVAVTAAHCVAINQSDPLIYQFPYYFMLLLGTESRDASAGNLYDVQRIIGHADYMHNTMENDIALLFLNGLIPWGLSQMRPIGLAREEPEPNTLCRISGWGLTSKATMERNATPDVLQEGRVSILGRARCTYLYPHFPRSEICAGHPNGIVDACMGDSGGPLVCNRRLTGLVSWGIGCGEYGFPGVYTNIAYFYNWIVAKNASLNYSDYDRYEYQPRTASAPQLGLHLLLAVLLAALAGPHIA